MKQKQKKPLPHGMTENMMQIAEISCRARAVGKHYGQYVARMNPGEVTQRRKAEVQKRTCAVCGADITHRSGGAKYCVVCSTEERDKVCARHKARKRKEEKHGKEFADKKRDTEE